ncbi:hypothetical protein QVD17_08620 [Tagetes erecta]|uniref:Uncharacterized protein n=1 Tax=Tagetes erecta TaxID=13708 RepID=A0AAD8KY52_TARER|nr:hypothetical protein QVD17_08620 [Tagetes erecta]
MNALSYRKMSIGNVEDVEMFAYIRDIANNDEDIEVVYHHISQGEIVNPLDLVDEIPDNLLDDDEYFARHPEDEEHDEDENESESGEADSEDDDDSDDGNDDVVEEDSDESVSEEAEKEDVEMDVEVVEPVVTENVEVNEPAEVVKAVEDVVMEAPRDITVHYSRSRRSKTVIEPIIVEEQQVLEDVYVPEQIDIVQIAQEVVAEVETVAQTVDDTDAGFIAPEPAEIATSSKAAEYTDQPKESSPKVASDVDLTEEEESVPIPDEAADLVNLDKAEGKRKLDAVPEIIEDDVTTKKARTEETVQIEPIQSESVRAAEVPEMVKVPEIVEEAVIEEASQFETVQTEHAPTIEALDDLDEVDFTESEPEANPDDEIPVDLDERFAYLEKMKYNPVYLKGLTVEAWMKRVKRANGMRGSLSWQIKVERDGGTEWRIKLAKEPSTPVHY